MRLPKKIQYSDKAVLMLKNISSLFWYPNAKVPSIKKNIFETASAKRLSYMMMCMKLCWKLCTCLQIIMWTICLKDLKMITFRRKMSDPQIESLSKGTIMKRLQYNDMTKPKVIHIQHNAAYIFLQWEYYIFLQMYIVIHVMDFSISNELPIWNRW